MITFVTYFVEHSKNCLENINKARKEFLVGEFIPLKHPEILISTMFQSARKHHPDGRFILLTDQNTQLDLPDFIKIARINNPDERFQLARYMYLPHIPELTSSDSHIIVLDSDIIIKDNLEEMFAVEADLYFTYQKDSTQKNVLPRSHKLKFPVNLGFVGINRLHKERAFKVLQSMLLSIRELRAKHFSYWFGMQYLLKRHFLDQLLEYEKEGRQLPYVVDHYGSKLLFVDAEIYNYPPNSYLHIPLTTKVVHFKGVTDKPLMFEYWKQINRQTNED